MKRIKSLVAGLLLISALPVGADELVRIGDIDGFGYGAATGWQAAGSGLANAGGNVVITAGDYLPDINNNGRLATGQGDDFDLRSVNEAADNLAAYSAGDGVVLNSGMQGVDFTDISLSTSYGTSQAGNDVLIDPTYSNPLPSSSFGAGGTFPAPPPTLPNQPGFEFNFTASKANYSSPDPIFFNLIFGDYDVTPAFIRITRADNTTRILTLMTQGAGNDGLIQAATATLGFFDVFTDGGGLVWNGSLKVDFVANNEPYTAFDYVELSTRALVNPVPAPPTLLLGLIGTPILAYMRARRRAA